MVCIDEIVRRGGKARIVRVIEVGDAIIVRIGLAIGMKLREEFLRERNVEHGEVWGCYQHRTVAARKAVLQHATQRLIGALVHALGGNVAHKRFGTGDAHFPQLRLGKPRCGGRCTLCHSKLGGFTWQRREDWIKTEVDDSKQFKELCGYAGQIL